MRCAGSRQIDGACAPSSGSHSNRTQRSSRRSRRRVASAASPRNWEANVNGTVAPIATQSDGTDLLRVLEAAADRLERAVDEVNALNVYPVPDGDTGTNMVHTVRSALKHARAAQPKIGRAHV